MTFGSFSADGREYILHRWDTPRPWINYLTNGRYCALISQTGGGYSFVESSGYNRITRGYPPLAVLEDRPGRYLYIKDAESGEYWSPTWQPVQRPLERYRCRHGMGYTNFSSASAGIAADLTFFVPVDRDCEVWMARLTNESGRTRRIQVFTYVELSLGSYAWDIEETSFANLFNTTSFEDGVIFATKRYWPVVQRLGKPNLAWAYQAFMGGSLPITGYDTFRESFLGVYGSLDRPRAVQQGQCGNSAGMGQDAAGVLQGEVELLPGASLDFVVVLGAAPDKAAGREIVRQLCVPGAAERELQKVKDFWDHYLGKLWVSTPDPDFDLSVNIWNKYQAWITYNWARMDS
ncbi:MAG: glycosyl transferase family 36, partial [Firmicutes bacterium]|nr:glycosyl transferase family 36 [Bacillota bacterium]